MARGYNGVEAVGGSGSSGAKRQNKIMRAELAKKRRDNVKKARREIRKKRKLMVKSGNPSGIEINDEGSSKKQEQITLESKRILDETVVMADEHDIAEEEQRDEFASVFNGEIDPKVLITTARNPLQICYSFIQSLLPMIPKSIYYKRSEYDIREIVKYAKRRAFSDILIVKDDRNQLTTLTHIHLPNGPTAVYRLTSFVPSDDIKDHGRRTVHIPEVILNRFTTQLGHRVGRMLGALWPHRANFEGRQAVTLHNQRDFIFFRFHRYQFNQDGSRAALQELGPRFTLKMRNLQKGTFDEDPEYEWIRKKGMGTRTSFYL